MKRYFIRRRTGEGTWEIVLQQSTKGVWNDVEVLPKVYDSRKEALEFGQTDYPLIYDFDPACDPNESYQLAVSQGEVAKATKLNPAYVLNRDANGKIESIDMVIGDDIYRASLTRDANGKVTNVSNYVLL